MNESDAPAARDSIGEVRGTLRALLKSNQRINSPSFGGKVSMVRLSCEQIYHKVPEAFRISAEGDAGPLSTSGSLFVVAEASTVVQAII